MLEKGSLFSNDHSMICGMMLERAFLGEARVKKEGSLFKNNPHVFVIHPNF
jgi:hypothetical protein